MQAASCPAPRCLLTWLIRLTALFAAIHFCPAFALAPGAYVSLAASAGHTCGLLATGTVQCWGHNAYGQLGNNSTTNSATPVSVKGLTNVVSIGAGLGHTCAVLASGGVQCWGTADNLTLDHSAIAGSLTPVSVNGLTNAISISAGPVHTCAVLASGGVRCWGLTAPQGLVSGLTTAISVSAGDGHNCAVLAAGGVECWGFNGNDQLGDGRGGSAALVPGPVVPGECTMDVDGDGNVATLTDILILGRASMGLSGSAVTQNAVGAQATRNTWTDIRAYLARPCGMRGLAP